MKAWGAKKYSLGKRIALCTGLALAVLAGISLAMGSKRFFGVSIYRPRQIAFAPSQEIPQDLLVAAHCVQSEPLVAEGNRKKKGIHVARKGARRFVYKPTGAMNGDFIRLIQMHGHEIDRASLAEAGGVSGGHPNIRLGADLVAVRNMNVMLKMILEGAAVGRKMIVVDLGAKFGKIFSLLEEALTFGFDEIFVYRDGGLTEAQKAVYKFVRGEIKVRYENWWDNRQVGAVTRAIAEAEIMAFYVMDVVTFDGQHYNLGMFEAAPLVAAAVAGNKNPVPVAPLVTYLPVRPLNGNYNQTYYAQNLNKYDAERRSAVCVEGEAVFRGTIQEFEERALRGGGWFTGK